MKKITLSLFVVFILAGVFVIETNAQSTITSAAPKALKYPFSLYKKIKEVNRLQAVSRSAGQPNIHLLVKGDVESIKASVESEGGKVKYAAGDIVAIILPVQKIDVLASKAFVRRIEACDAKLETFNDQMVLNNNVYLVQQGVNLPQGYDGKGVCVGIIDEGIDVTHKDLRDVQGHTRIKWLWDQRLGIDPTYTPPLYGYGQSFTNTQIDNVEAAAVIDHDFSHGTFVTGVAAGNGLAVNNYHGVAPNADIIFVAANLNTTDDNFLYNVADAVQYIFDRADSLHEPCSINISLGTRFGSHDGKDLQSQIIGNLVSMKNGRFIACAAGNDGAAPIHLHTEVTPDTAFTWFGGYSSTQPLYFELWSDTNDIKNIEWAVGADETSPLYDYRGGTNFRLITSKYGDDTTSIYAGPNRIGFVETFVDSSEGRYALECQITPDSANYRWRFMTRGTGRFDVWSLDLVPSDLPDPSTYPIIAKYKLPDTDETLASSFNCNPKLMTVGSYINRSRYTDMNSVLEYDSFPQPVSDGTKFIVGGLASTSSHGPTRDGRIKPDITSTGQWLLSCAASYDLNGSNGNNGLYAIASWGVAPGGQHKRGSGTSFASPVIAGAAALYLQKNPTASYLDIMNAMTSCPKTDQYTGSALPNNYWGYGKLDAYKMIKGCALGINEQDEPLNIYLENYPNPFNDQTTIHYDLSYLNKAIGNASIVLTDALGRHVRDITLNGMDGDIVLNKNTVVSGVYFYSLVLDGKIVRTNKLVVL